MTFVAHDRWREHLGTGLPPISGHAMIAMGDNIFICGGKDDQHEPTLQGLSWTVFSTKHKCITHHEWLFPVLEPTGRNGHCMWRVGGTSDVLLFGGVYNIGVPFYPGNLPTRILAFRVSDSGRPVPIPTPQNFNIPHLICPAQCVDERSGFIHVLGGFSPMGHTNELYRYTPHTDETFLLRTSGACPPKSFKGTLCVVADTQTMYSFGGWADDMWLGGYEMNMATMVWTCLIGGPSPRSRTVFVPFQRCEKNFLLLCGGMTTGNTRLRDTWIYNIARKTWLQLVVPIEDTVVQDVSAHQACWVAAANSVWMYGGSDAHHGLAGKAMCNVFELAVAETTLKELVAAHLVLHRPKRALRPLSKK